MRKYYIGEEPMACPRPRVTKSGRAYMPKKYTNWKKLAGVYLFEQWQGEVYSSAVSVRIIAVFKRLSRTPKKRPERIWKASKPDADNIAKSCLDLMVDVGILEDDNIVARLVIEKHHAGLGEHAHISIEVANVEE
jgi:Holliday junction resolvase RusA-like endonuclease